MRPQVRDLGATRELLAHHLSDLDDILAALRIRNGAFSSAHPAFLALCRVTANRTGPCHAHCACAQACADDAQYIREHLVCRLPHAFVGFCGQTHTLCPPKHGAAAPTAAATCETDTSCIFDKQALYLVIQTDDQYFDAC